MTIRMFARLGAVALLLLAIGAEAGRAQTATTTEAISAQVAQTLGAAPATVEVSKSIAILTISRVDSPLNGATHGARSAEAAAIAASISQSLKGLPDAAKLLTLNVDYVKRAGVKGSGKLVDRVEFRRNADGVFAAHVT
jgi:hypothetical protein